MMPLVVRSRCGEDGGGVAVEDPPLLTGFIDFSTTATDARHYAVRLLAAADRVDPPPEPSNGRTPYGWRYADRGRLVPDVVEQAIMDTMAGGVAAGRKYGAIAEQLNSSGHRTRRGEPWTRQSVQRIAERIVP